MKRSPVESPVGFADAELIAYTRDDDALVVTLSAWNEQSLVLTFRDVLRVLDNDLGDVSGFCSVAGPTEFLLGALERLYEGAPPPSHPYTQYQLLDHDDTPAFEVVAGSVDVQCR